MNADKLALASLPIGYVARDAGFTAANVVVGCGATLGIGGDWYPGTVIEIVRIGDVVTKITVQADRGHSGVYVSDPKGETYTFSLRKDGSYRQVRNGCFQLSLGHRQSHRDPSF